ncbi:MAG: hypothetical protein KatS3mg110_0485 [Pirellulaceae bacterium]|nr:MAG: hypothetical protein KatS3mg110_0475 [Pirellulaceae bacterium]GIW92444.1 MAG: hypothetical protein KatS3mg110_0485 [Pirellulaceae bacterium]
MMQNDKQLAPGDVVAGLEPSELVEVQRVAPFGNRTLVEGVGLQSHRVVKRPLTGEEPAALVKVRGREHTFDGDAQLFLLGVEAERIRIAHQFDPLFAVNSSIVDRRPQPLEAGLDDGCGQWAFGYGLPLSVAPLTKALYNPSSRSDSPAFARACRRSRPNSAVGVKLIS